MALRKILLCSVLLCLVALSIGKPAEDKNIEEKPESKTGNIENTPVKDIIPEDETIQDEPADIPLLNEIKKNENKDVKKVADKPESTETKTRIRPVSKTIDRNDCQWQFTVRADTNICHDGRVAVAACGSNDNAACVDSQYQNTVHTGLLCCATNDTCGNSCGKVSSEVGADSGVPAYCPSGQVVVSSCGSGGDSHCYHNGIYYSIVIKCRESIVVPSTTCLTQCAQKGINTECPIGYVMTGWCGSNGSQKCNNNNDSHCITCCTHN